MDNTPLLKGAFCDNLKGLEYETPTMAGMTDERGEFAYRPGETVTFSIGGTVTRLSFGR